MALKVKAKERKFKIGKYAGEWRYVMQPELYSSLTQSKVIREAALRSGVSEGVMQACWDAAGEVIKAWLPEGHSIPLPGLGSCRVDYGHLVCDGCFKSYRSCGQCTD